MRKPFIIIGCFIVLLFSMMSAVQAGTLPQPASQGQTLLPPITDMIMNFGRSTGLFSFFSPGTGNNFKGIGQFFMIGVGVLLLYLAISKNFEPLLLIPIGFGAILSNTPLASMSDPGGVLYYIYTIGIKTGVFPLLIFMGVGAMTDFGPLIANPKTLLLGAAAQVGIFTTIIGALILSEVVPGIHFDLLDAASIGIIGGADGPTAIFLSSQLAPHLLGPIAVAAYSYMALVPLIQPPIMRALTTVDERRIRMKQLRHVGKVEKMIFPLSVLCLCVLLLPTAAPLIGFFMFGNLMRECKVVDRLSKTAQNALINIVTILLGLGVGAQLSAHQFLNLSTLGILFLGVIAFSIGTASGILMAKLMNLFFKTKINPLIGSAGVSAVPMAARVSQKVGMEADPQNMLLMHAMGPNVAGVIGSAVAAGVLLTLKSLAM
ncbi:sodium ion-translocating decarboxylase subunit beta [Desulfobacula sp.]|uniref:sodium ion-translocating decarboxylase subunit beta n=1 Tax=Desulfobacula sp. TaxID=2593537 RepID=UPI00262F3141|nr:sodium ion-translocating decarboxylase subunit beta [Desulfobacula sp.]